MNDIEFGECSVCGKELPRCGLHRHHKDGNQKNNIDKNLALLCPKCHRLIHILNRQKEPKKGEIIIKLAKLQKIELFLGKLGQELHECRAILRGEKPQQEEEIKTA